MTSNPFGFRSKTTQMMNSSIFRSQRTPNIIRLMKYPIGSVAFFLRPQTARATYFFFNVRCRAFCLLTRVRPGLCTEYSTRE